MLTPAEIEAVKGAELINYSLPDGTIKLDWEWEGKQ